MSLNPIIDTLVIGGGIAGAATAMALAARGNRVMVCEAQSELATKGSGNAIGIFMPYVAPSNSPPGIAYAIGYRLTHTLLKSDQRLSNLYHECGVLQLPSTKRLHRLLTTETQLLDGIIAKRLSALESAEVAGIDVGHSSFYLPQAGFCKPRELTAALIETAQKEIVIRCGAEVTDLQEHDQAWRVQLSDGSTVACKIVVLCGAYEISRLKHFTWIPLEPIRGQTAQALASPESTKLRAALAFDSYITPAHQGTHFVGAHYLHSDMTEEVNHQHTAQILERIYSTLPSISPLTPKSARVCFRTSTFDRMPYVGKLPGSHAASIYINSGHGSRGLITAPLGGEMVARLIYGEDLGELNQTTQILGAQRLEHYAPRLS